MKLSESIKPISYLKAHASQLIRDISSNKQTVVITQNGEAKVVVQDVKVYEQIQESLAMLRILVMSKKNLEKGNFKPIDKAFGDLRNRINQDKIQ